MKFIKFTILILAACYGLQSWSDEHKHHHHHAQTSLEPASQAQSESLYEVSGIWEDQWNQSFSLKDLSGLPHLFVMLYTKCESACPILVEDVKRVVAALKAEHQNLSVILFSIDAEGETQRTLNTFAEKRRLKKHWRVARANSRDIATLAAVLGVNYKKLPDGEYVHSNSIYFVDKTGSLVAQQDGLNKLDSHFVKAIQNNLQNGSTQKLGIWGRVKKYLETFTFP